MNKKKYLVLIFSDNKGKPSKNAFGNRGAPGTGIRHFEEAYIKKLPIIAQCLNRTCVFPPPFS